MTSLAQRFRKWAIASRRRWVARSSLGSISNQVVCLASHDRSRRNPSQQGSTHFRGKYIGFDNLLSDVLRVTRASMCQIGNNLLMSMLFHCISEDCDQRSAGICLERCVFGLAQHGGNENQPTTVELPLTCDYIRLEVSLWALRPTSVQLSIFLSELNNSHRAA